MKRTLSVLLLCAILFGNASAQSRGRGGASARLGLDPGSFTSTRSLLVLGIAGVAAAWTWEETDENFPPLRSTLDQSAFDGAFDVGNTYGGGWVIGGGSLGLLAIGSLADDPETFELGADLTRAYLYSSLITGSLKFAVDRRRPSGGPLSFPSGHTTSAFSTVPVIWEHLGWESGVVASVLASFTAFGRMEENRHYLSDVIAGAAIGYLTGAAVASQRRSSRPQVQVTARSVGLGWSF